MPNITLSAAHFPDGTSVGAYPVSNWGGETKPSGAPQGNATATVVASNGVAFTNLAAGAYWAVGQVAGVYRYVRFVAGEDFAADPLMKAANLSDLAIVATARTNLGLGTAALSAVGDFQPSDADLTAIAALTTTAFGRGFLDLVDAPGGRTKLGLGTAALSASTDFQPIDSDLTAIAALTTTAFGRALLAVSDYSAEHANGTLAARPAAATPGRTYYATDTKITYLDNGTAWLPMNVGVLGQSAVAVSNTAVTTEETLATITVPANALGANGRLRITTLWTMTNSANAKTPRVRFSGAAGTIFTNFVLTTSVGYRDQVELANRNATNSQVAQNATVNGHWGNGTGAATTSAVDTTAATSIVISGQKALAAEVLTLESYLVELMPG